jgi:poly(A) polymerase
VGIKSESSPEIFTEIVNTSADLTNLFKDNGFRLYFVGGIVRDLLLGYKPDVQDLDCTTDASPKEIKRIVQPIADAVWLQGERFGTVGMRVNGTNYEITTHRAESYVDDSRKPVVNFSTNLSDDLIRRDFTVNAMAVDTATGELFDPYGGVKDLEEMTLRTPMDPEESFTDDPLRILRAARFIAAYGFSPTGDLLQAAQKISERLNIVSIERIRDEIFRLLSVEDPRLGLKFLSASKTASYVFPEVFELSEERQEMLFNQVSLVEAEPLMRLAVFKEMIPDSRLRSFRLSSKELVYVEKIRNALVLLEKNDQNDWSDAKFRRLAFDTEGALDDVVRIWERIFPKNLTVINELKRLNEAGEFTTFEPFFDGETIMNELGIEPGPDVGTVTDWLISLRIEEGSLSEEQVKQKLHIWWDQRSK